MFKKHVRYDFEKYSTGASTSTNIGVQKSSEHRPALKKCSAKFGLDDDEFIDPSQRNYTYALSASYRRWSPSEIPKGSPYLKRRGLRNLMLHSGIKDFFNYSCCFDRFIDTCRFLIYDLFSLLFNPYLKIFGRSCKYYICRITLFTTKLWQDFNTLLILLVLFISSQFKNFFQFLTSQFRRSTQTVTCGGRWRKISNPFSFPRLTSTPNPTHGGHPYYLRSLHLDESSWLASGGQYSTDSSSTDESGTYRGHRFTITRSNVDHKDDARKIYENVTKLEATRKSSVVQNQAKSVFRWLFGNSAQLETQKTSTNSRSTFQISTPNSDTYQSGFIRRLLPAGFFKAALTRRNTSIVENRCATFSRGGGGGAAAGADADDRGTRVNRDRILMTDLRNVQTVDNPVPDITEDRTEFLESSGINAFHQNERQQFQKSGAHSFTSPNRQPATFLKVNNLRRTLFGHKNIDLDVVEPTSTFKTIEDEKSRERPHRKWVVFGMPCCYFLPLFCFLLPLTCFLISALSANWSQIVSFVPSTSTALPTFVKPWKNVVLKKNGDSVVDYEKSLQSKLLALQVAHDEQHSNFATALLEINNRLAILEKSFALSDTNFEKMHDRLRQLETRWSMKIQNLHLNIETENEKRVNNAQSLLSYLDRQLSSVFFNATNECRSELELLRKEFGSLSVNGCKCVQESPLEVQSPVLQVKSLIRDAIMTYDADKTGLPDYAFEPSGGSIIDIKCSETYSAKTRQLSWMGWPLWFIDFPPSVTIQPGLAPGNCWAFKGSRGTLVVKLSHTLRITGVSYEHIPKRISTDQNIESAPKKMEIYGHLSKTDKQPRLLGNLTYNIDDSPLQYFPIKTDHGLSFPIVEWRIITNHGHPMYTCIYRIRVHGDPVDRNLN